jgi:hypothetical protein
MGGPAKSKSTGPQGLEKVTVTEQEESPLFRKAEEEKIQSVIFK